ncbi:MAG: TonB-dependent receptor [Bacteroidales bacterium]|nr:TonB-dependent receptor [Bacteroidales bacterium]
MKRRNLILALILLFTSTLLSAQSHNEEVTIEGSYTPHIKKSERLMKMPEMPKREFSIPNYEVSTEDFFYNYKVELEPISPLQYNHSKFEEITNNFIKAGIGTRLSPDFLFRHYSDLTKKSSLGIGVAHNSSWLGMKNYPSSKYMNNDFGVSMSNRFSGFQLHSYVDYHYDAYNLNDDTLYYGKQFDADFDNKRDIHSLNVRLLANNNQTSYNSLYDEFLLDYAYSGIQGGIQENYLNFNAYLEHSNSWFRNSDGVQTLALKVKADVDNISQSLFLIAANPYLAFDGDYFNLHLGFRLDAKTNSTSMGGIYPDVKGSLYLFGRNIEFYAGLGGGTKINTLKEILEENPFIVTNPLNYAEFDYEKTYFDFQGGLKFKAMDMVNGHFGVRYRKIDNHVFYVGSSVQPNAFDIILNDCYVLNFNADVHAKINDEIKVVADFAYNKYDFLKANTDMTLDVPVVKNYAWYKPEVEFALRGVYKYGQNWNFKLASYVEGGRYALIDYSEIQRMKAIVDIQLGCAYNFNEDITFYAEVKNLVHNKYQMYYGYPSYGFQMFLGFKYRFL